MDRCNTYNEFTNIMTIPLWVQFSIMAGSMLIAQAAHYFVIVRNQYSFQKDLLWALILYQFAMALRPALAGLQWYMCHYLYDYSSILTPFKYTIYNMPLFVLFYILFKIKKIQIVLNLENASPITVTKRLIRFIYYSRLFLVITVFEIIFLFVTILLITVPGDDSYSELIRPLAIFTVVNNCVIFAYMSYLLGMFYRMGEVYMKLLSMDDPSFRVPRARFLLISLIIIIVVSLSNYLVIEGVIYLRQAHVSSWGPFPDWF